MDQFKNLPPQYKLLIGVGFLGFVAASWYYLVIMEIDAEISQTQAGHMQVQNQLKEFEGFQGELEIANLREQYANVIQKIEANKEIIPTDEKLPQLMASLETDALDAGLTLVSKEQLPKEAEDFYITIPIKMEVTGSYLALVRFLKLISLPGKRLVNVGLFDIRVLDTRRQKRKKDGPESPFGATGRVAAAESEISATFVVSGFKYTGGGGGGGGKGKKGKSKKK